MKQNYSKHCLMLAVTAAFILTASRVFAADPAAVAANADKYGMLTLIPPLLAITLAFITKNVILSLFLGVFSGTFMLELKGFNVISAFVNGFVGVTHKILSSLADPWNAGIILQCLAIGALIALVSKMGGTRAIAESLAKKAKSPTSSQIVTWLLGLVIFFDDYANSLTVGPIMRPVTDRMRISREKLAFIIDSTAAPIAGIALISTWVGYEMGLIKDGYEIVNMQVNAYSVFVSTIPYRFYNILILIFIVVSALTLREFGPMYKAEIRARKTGKVLDDNAKPMITEETAGLEPDKGTKLSIWNAIIPIGTLIFGALIGFYVNGYFAIMGGDNNEVIMLMKSSPASFTAIREAFGAADASIVLFQAALFAGIVAMVMGVFQRIFTWERAVHYWLQGVKSLIITGVILLLAWSLSGVIKELGTAKYLSYVLSDKIPRFTLPSIIFILGAIISFATGTSYGTMGILMPMAIPLAHAIDPNQGYILMSVGAVLTGAIFGDHCSPISDTTILSSMGSSCDHIDHTKTQMVYAVTVAGVAIFCGYIPVGLGVPISIVLPVSMIATIAVVYLLGKPVGNGEAYEEPAAAVAE